MAELDAGKQRSFAVDVVRQLRAQGFKAYWAGGCVRDSLLGRPSKDYDVATSARPKEIRQVFHDRKTIAIGAAFGVITVLGPRGAGQIEVATFRQDASYSDGRHPDAVAFSTAEEDARRRDFTINGMFFDPVTKQVIDYVGGQQDLFAGLIRAIGDPRERFAEDKLRLLRAVRFAALLGFTLDDATQAAMAEMASEVGVVSAERIAIEMKQMLTGPGRVRALTLLAEVGLLHSILPEVHADAADPKWQTVLSVLEQLESPSFPLGLAAVLFGFVDGQQAEDICRRWKLSNADTSHTRWLVENHPAIVAASDATWPPVQRLLVAPGAADLLTFAAAIATATGGPMAGVDYCRRALARPAGELDPAPLLSGGDLIAHGVAQGKQYAELLTAVRDAQLTGQIQTKQQALALVDTLRQPPPASQ